jgi:hypothetical protein
MSADRWMTYAELALAEVGAIMFAKACELGLKGIVSSFTS